MKLRLLLWLIGAVVIVVLVYLAVRQWGAVGSLLLPVAVVTAGAAAVLKKGGAKPIPANKNRPRMPGPSAVSPEPEPGKKRARPRRNRGRY